MSETLRLGAATRGRLPAEVVQPAYPFAEQQVGIVHFGIGAFHRAHQAWYIDRAMDAGDRNWAIAGVSLRSGDVAAQMNPQDGLYTVTERSGTGHQTRLVGAVRDVAVAPRQREAVLERLAAPSTHIASFTVTEKGYCRRSDGSLDPDLAGENSIFALVAAGLRRRHDSGVGGLTLLSCDNLADNGHQLARLMAEYLDRTDPALRGWFEAECACPSTMVDRIVPATTAQDRADLALRIGMADEAAVMTEPFSQWVVENRFAGARPRLEAVGVELVDNVQSYETAKLRMLNGAHSLLAYVGLAHGHEFVHQAVANPLIRPLVEHLMRLEAAPTIAAAPGQDLRLYAEALLARFANPALQHKLAQIAMDGSQKIPQRWLETLAAAQAQGKECPAIITGLAAWVRHLRGLNGPVDDPRAAELAPAAAAPDALDRLLGAQGLLASAWHPQDQDRTAFTSALASLG